MAHSNKPPQFRPQRATTSRDLRSTRVLHHIEMGLTTGQSLYTVMHLEVYSWRSLTSIPTSTKYLCFHTSPYLLIAVVLQRPSLYPCPNLHSRSHSSFIPFVLLALPCTISAGHFYFFRLLSGGWLPVHHDLQLPFLEQHGTLHNARLNAGSLTYSGETYSTYLLIV